MSLRVRKVDEACLPDRQRRQAIRHGTRHCFGVGVPAKYLGFHITPPPRNDIGRGGGVIMGGRLYFVYIMTNTWRTVLYTGVTNDVIRRAGEHANKASPRSFTAKYNCRTLVYYEVYGDPRDAIAREKQVKGGPRRKKLALVNRKNPDWKDLLPELENGNWPW